jgi:hypothetical protein
MFDAKIDECFVDHSCSLCFGHLDREAVVGREFDVVTDGELTDHHIFLRNKPHELLPSDEMQHRGERGRGGEESTWRDR